MKRPTLNAAPIPRKVPPEDSPFMLITLGDWHKGAETAYERGALLLEIEDLDGEERVVRAWKKPAEATP